MMFITSGQLLFVISAGPCRFLNGVSCPFMERLPQEVWIGFPILCGSAQPWPHFIRLEPVSTQPRHVRQSA